MKTSYFAQKKVLDANPNLMPISIARNHPRWWPLIATYTHLAPTRSMRKNGYTREEFETVILAQRNAKICYDALTHMAKGKEPVLLCYEKPPFNDTHWCHRRIVAEWFEAVLGIYVPEYDTTPNFLPNSDMFAEPLSNLE